MSKYCYVPSLKSKRGEALALRELNSATKAKIKPIINIVNDIDASKFYESEAFVDLHLNKLQNCTEPMIEESFSHIYERAYKKSNLTSVLRHGYSSDLISRLKPFLFNSEKGVALRIPRISLPYLEQDIRDISGILSLSSELIDVIIDFECINDMALGLIKEFAINIKKATSKINIGNIVILSSAFPDGLKIPSNTIGELPRYDWALYKGLQNIMHNVIFGDYGSDDPFDPQIDSRRNIVPTIRYTIENSWKIIRGRYDPSMPFDFSQFSDLSNKLIACDFYKGKDYSWGDNRIYQCAKKLCGNGNLMSWVTISMNHHITFAANECDRLLGF